MKRILLLQDSSSPVVVKDLKLGNYCDSVINDLLRRTMQASRKGHLGKGVFVQSRGQMVIYFRCKEHLVQSEVRQRVVDPFRMRDCS